MIPKQERLANALKAKTDEKVGEVLNLSEEKVKRRAKTVGQLLRREGEPARVVVTGGAGAGKSTFAGSLSDILEVPVFDFDKYIKGGFTPDASEYKDRLNSAVYDLWSDLPKSDTGYIIEHVESCNPTLIRMLNPNFAVLLDPGEEHLKRTAQVRNQVGMFNRTREKRALDSMKTARKHFDDAPGTIVMKDGGILVKQF